MCLLSTSRLNSAKLMFPSSTGIVVFLGTVLLFQEIAAVVEATQGVLASWARMGEENRRATVSYTP